MKILSLFSVVLLTSIATGCSLVDTKNQDQTKDQIIKFKAQQSEQVEFAKDLYLPVSRISQAKTKEDLLLNKPFIRGLKEVSLSDIASEIQDGTGIKVHINQDVYQKPKNQNVDDAQPQSPVTMEPNQFDEMGNPIPIQVDDKKTRLTAFDEVTFSHSGTISSFLDALTKKYTLSWEFDAKQNMIVIYRFKKAIYPISMFGSAETTVSANMQSSSLTQTIQTRSVNNGLEGVVDVVKTLLSDEGRVEVDTANRSLVVVDYPGNLRMVEKYVNDATKKSRSKAVIDFKVLSLKITNEKGFSFNPDALIKGIVDGDIRVSGSVPDVLGNSFQYAQESGDVSALVNAFKSLGKVSTVYEDIFYTDHNQPYVTQDLVDNGYIQSVGATTVDEAGRVLPGEVNSGKEQTGANITVVPQINNNHEIGLDLNFSLSALVERKTYEGSLVENLIIARKSFKKRVTLQTGKVYVLKRFVIKRDSTNKTGTGHEDNMIAGGSAEQKNEVDYWIVVAKVSVV